jgi:hypothetical protein
MLRLLESLRKFSEKPAEEEGGLGTLRRFFFSLFSLEALP